MASNMFIVFKTPDITGESADSSNTNAIQVLSWSHSFNQPTSPTRSSAGSGTVEQANHSDFSFTKYMDAATDDLLKMCWSGQQIGTATFSAYRSDGANTAIKYLEVVMTNVIVSNVSVGGGTGDIPTETVTLSYSSVQYTYIQQKTADGTAGGNQPIKHDLAAQTVS
ncbi:Hcp family type VI secretion system effector [Azospirillum agricola]|uniref:Hcp family type VI secretion system effector n=1 Tax=Azospirillum agricola TaxID=1720247 RepID=UPI000A0F31C3|nr:type VI secretion system tube protein Hcp [Azospirillum agricola]SMH63015.1 type VI secretion system secreted protein Hcp [Azospirillum lipoferum]